jgi:hypothetical protein
VTRIRLIDTPAGIAAALDVYRTAGWIVRAGRAHPARTPGDVRVYADVRPAAGRRPAPSTLTVPATAGQVAAAGLPWGADAAAAGVVQP